MWTLPIFLLKKTGTLFVADSGNHRVQAYDIASGEYTRTVIGDAGGIAGATNGFLNGSLPSPPDTPGLPKFRTSVSQKFRSRNPCRVFVLVLLRNFARAIHTIHERRVGDAGAVAWPTDVF